MRLEEEAKVREGGKEGGGREGGRREGVVLASHIQGGRNARLSVCFVLS